MDRDTDAVAARYDSAKPLQVIEEDIARTRLRLSATINALERELTPHRVIENGAEMLRKSLEPRPGPFRDQVWAYAIPLALIVSGLGWLFVLRQRSHPSDIPSAIGVSEHPPKSQTTPDVAENLEVVVPHRST
jgi:Protein of unknown function (DUF3618)